MNPAAKRRNLLIGGLALALGVYGVDQLTRGGGAGPSHAAAASTSARPGARPIDWSELEKMYASLAKNSPTAATIAAAARERRDLFAPSGAWAPKLEAAQPQPSETTTAPPPPAYEQRHRLDAIVLGPTPVAVISGRVLRVGEALDGATLVEISRDAVALRDLSTGASIRLDLPHVPGSPRP